MNSIYFILSFIFCFLTIFCDTPNDPPWTLVRPQNNSSHHSALSHYN